MYQALARKYRPQTWATVVGQSHVTQTLSNALTGDRLHHAYLFCGARGVGKTTAARILAKAVNCRAREGAEPCNTCQSCHDITDGSSLDVQEIDGASNTSVDDVREIRERLKYLPAGEGHKIYIIDEVHMLSKAAFNALLKTLEEPPPHVLFIFATTEPQKIPVTILSRCQRYDFRRVSVHDIVASLKMIAEQEGVTIPEDLLFLIAYEADGGMRDAQSLLDQIVAACGNAVSESQIRDLFGLTDRTALHTLFTAICARDAKGALAGFAAINEVGTNLPRLAQELLELFRHLWIHVTCGALPNSGEISAHDTKAIEENASGKSVEECQQWFAILFRGIDAIIRGRFPRLAMESCVLQMVQVGPVEPIGDLLDRVDAMTSPDTNTSTHQHPNTSTHQRTNTVATGFLDQLRKARPQLASIVDHGTVVQANATHLELHFPRDSLYGEMLKEADRLAQLKVIAGEILGNAVRVTLSHAAGPSVTEQRTQVRKAKEAASKSHQKEALEHELVREASRTLGAEVTEVKLLTK
jgi:DNA polymerase III subunit gamma/tau